MVYNGLQRLTPQVIGRGSFAKVLLTRLKRTGESLNHYQPL